MTSNPGEGDEEVTIVARFRNGRCVAREVFREPTAYQVAVYVLHGLTRRLKNGAGPGQAHEPEASGA